jgi:HK97 family phage major capsid protein
MIRKAHESDYVRKAAAGMGELVGSDGGFLVPPQFSNTIFERVYKENDLLKRTDQYTVTGNSMVFPRNAESSRANGSRWGGARAYWTQEGSTITASRPTFGRLQLNLHKLACITPITSELIEDSGPAVAQYTQKVFANEINFVVGDSLVNGTGAGMPLGILSADCTLSVSKETGQAAATVVPANIAKMWARRFKAGSTGQYVWLINQDVGPQLHLMTLGIGTAGQVVYMPPGGLSSAPYATLMGAPVIETEWNATLGTVGDILLVDMSQWVSISKGGMESATSMHVYFTTDEQAFRTTFRLDAQPWWASVLTPFKGSNTQAPAISLATRA